MKQLVTTPFGWILVVCCILDVVSHVNGETFFDCHGGPIIQVNWNESYPISDPVFNCSVNSSYALEITKGNIDNLLTIHNDAGFGVAYFQKTPSFQAYPLFDILVNVINPPEGSDPVEIMIVNGGADLHYPTFNISATQVSVKENNWDNSIAIFFITDGDSTDEFNIKSVRYSFKLPMGDYNGTFNMSSTIVDKTAEVKIGLQKQLDYETAVFYTLVIVAEDGGGLETEATLNVNVIDQEDTPPQFTKIKPYVEIPEDAEIETSVLQVAAIDGDRGINHPIRYAIEAGNDGADFKIDEIDGTIFVAHKLDADNKSRTSLYNLNISATKQNVSDPSSPYVAYTTSVISVTDIDDNPPIFTSDTYFAQIDELSSDGDAALFVGRKYITVTDADLGENAHFTMKLNDDSGIFMIDPGDGEKQETFSILVKNNANLNCDILQGVNMTVVVTDVNQPSFTNKAVVSLTINDVNNHWPEFEKTNYEVAINETTVAGIDVLTVTAKDKDINKNYNHVYYRFDYAEAPIFVIGRDNGIIGVAPGVTLDRDVQANYTLTVKADDGTVHDEATNDTCYVSVVLLDVNNKPPTFMDDGKFVMEIEENTDNGGRPIFRVNATDPDLNHILEYKIDYGSSRAYDNNDKNISFDLTIFKIDKDIGDISLNQKLDREVTKDINLALVVTDIKTEAGIDHSTGTLIINIDDVDDNAPVFSQNEYFGSIQENMENAQISLRNGTGFLKITATDADAIYNVITLNVISNDHPECVVTIDTDTGLLTVGSQAFDYETFHFVNLIVEATDNGVPPLTANVSVNISVLDQNDNSPVFENTTYTFYLPENNFTFCNGSEVKADDADSGQYGVVTYLIRDSQFLFYVNVSDTTGVVVVTDTFDYETIQHIEGTVFGFDNYFSKDGSVHNVDKTQVIIEIIDENDNWPQFLNWDTVFNIPEDANINIPIGTVNAIDYDLSPKYSTLKFKNLTDVLFSINTDSGQLSIASSLIDLVGLHSVFIKVCDTGEPPNGPNCNETYYNITVTDVNNHPPEIDFPLESQTTSIVEGFISDELVYYVNFTDDDTDLKNKVSEFNMSAKCIQGGTAGYESSLFHVESYDMSGEVHVQGNVSRDICFVYQLDLSAHNLNNPTMQSTVRTCYVVIQSNHHHDPQFPPGAQFKVSFTEEQEPGSPVYLPAQPYSPDSEGTGNITVVYCFILGGPYADYFEITDHLLCNFTTKKVLDRESIPSFDDMQVILFASESSVTPERDDHYDSKNASQLLAHITCLDINDNPPVFNQTKFYGGVSSDTVMGTNLMNLTAYDVDTVDDGQLRYSIVGVPTFHDNGNAAGIAMNPFTVNDVTGYVVLNYKFSDNQHGYIDLTVQVVDSNATHSAQSKVSVYVVSKDQKLSCLAECSPDVFISSYSDSFAEDFTNAIGARVVLDVVQVHVDESGAKLTTLSDVYIHLVNEDKNTVLDATTAADLIDSKNKILMEDVYPKYHILRVTPPQVDESNVDTKFFVLVAIALVLAVVLALTLSVCVYKGYRLKRQLKAATATAFGSQQSGLNRVEVPNTNKHMIEGSNPVWNLSNDEEGVIKGNYDEISDTNSLQDIDNENEFKGGQNNPTFEDRIENVFRNALQDGDDHAVDNDSLYSYASEREIQDRNLYNEINDNFSYGPKLIDPQIHTNSESSAIQKSDIHFV